MTLLNPGDDFPDLTLNLIGGGTLSLPRDIEGKWGFLAVYRGSW